MKSVFSEDRDSLGVRLLKEDNTTWNPDELIDLENAKHKRSLSGLLSFNNAVKSIEIKYKDKVYYPAQNCEKGYGCAINIKEIEYKDGNFLISDVKTIKSTHKRYNIGLHTLNEYKGVAVIDVHGYRYGVVGKLITYLVKVKKYIKQVL